MKTRRQVALRDEVHAAVDADVTRQVRVAVVQLLAQEVEGRVHVRGRVFPYIVQIDPQEVEYRQELTLDYEGWGI